MLRKQVLAASASNRSKQCGGWVLDIDLDYFTTRNPFASCLPDKIKKLWYPWSLGMPFL